MPTSYVKDPDADLDYTINWAGWLPGDDTLFFVEWIVADGINGHDQTRDTTTATIWLAGGTIGVTYAVTCRVTTQAGRKNDSTIFVTVAES